MKFHPGRRECSGCDRTWHFSCRRVCCCV